MFNKKFFLIIIALLALCNFSQAMPVNSSKWITLGCGKFQFTGNPTNRPEKITTFIVNGKSIKSPDNLSIDIHMYMEKQKGQRVALSGLSGKVTIDDVDLGISGDSSYVVHFTKDDNGIQKKIALMNISDGATVDNHYNIGVDNDARIKFCDGSHAVFTTEKFLEQKYTTFNTENDGNGFELTVSNGIFTEIGGLKDGFNITIKPGSNIGDKLTFKTNGGRGTITIADETFTVSGDKEFTATF